MTINNHSAALIHVIDDEPSLRTALSRLLIACGFRVALYDSAEAFLSQHNNDSVDSGCILLDINMPGMSGLQLQEHLRHSANTLPIIFLTGNGDLSLRDQAIQAGAEEFLSKPTSKPELLAAIERALCHMENK